MQTKKLHRFDVPWQADMMASELEQVGIKCDTKPASREYVAILTGMGFTPTDLYVDEDNLTKAKVLLQKFLSKAHTNIKLVENSESKPITPNYYRRVLFFSLASIVTVPIIFNIVAALNFREMLKKKSSTFQDKMIAGFVMTVSTAVAVLFAFWIYEKV